MKNKLFITVLGIIMIAAAAAGCDKTQQPWPEENNTPPPPAATATPSGSTFTVIAIILAMGGMPGGSVTLMDGAAPVTGATVVINTVTFTDIGGGNYSGTFAAPFAAGDTISLSVTSSAGSVTASGTVPAAGSTNPVAISGAAAGSTLSISF